VSGPATGSALQSALAAENAAIYGYGVAGAHLPATARSAAQQDWVQHQATRDTLQAMMTSRGFQPLPAQAAYQLPFPVHTAQAAVSLAGYLENQLAAAYLGLVALDDAQLRAWGAQQAQACACRGTTWLGRTAAFPGLPARAYSTPSPRPTATP
jgi:hypothetical protein